MARRRKADAPVVDTLQSAVAVAPQSTPATPDPPVVEPAVAAGPAPAAVEQPDSMADRAARYGRRPPPDSAPVQRRAPPPLQPRYPYAPPGPRAAADVPAAAEPQVLANPVAEPGQRRALSMAEIALRQRTARQVARPAEPVYAATAVPIGATSMQDRALRFRTAVPEPKPAQAAAIPDQGGAHLERPLPADSQQRAREVMRHRQTDSDTVGPPQIVATPANLGTVLVIACRNHATILRQRLSQWRLTLPELDIRHCVLDLGSTDDSAAIAEDVVTIKLLHRPGGLAEPRATLFAVLRQCLADVVVVVDAATEAGPAAQACAQAVRAGAAIAYAPPQAPTVFAISAMQWRKAPPAADQSLGRWAARHGGVVKLSLGAGRVDPSSLVQALVAISARRRDRVLALLPAPVRGAVQRLESAADHVRARLLP